MEFTTLEVCLYQVSLTVHYYLNFLLPILWFVYALVWMRANVNKSDEYNEDIAAGVLVTEFFQHDFQ